MAGGRALEDELHEACTAQRWEPAITLAIRGYSGELLGFIHALLRNPAAAHDVFSTVCEKLWQGLPTFAWKSSFRTWAYSVTRNECVSHLRGARERPTVSLSSPAVAAIAAAVRTDTASFLNSDTKDKLAAVRAALDPDDQTLLILRVDRNLEWRDIARVFEPDATAAAIDRRAATLRKRLERLKVELRETLGPRR